MNAACLSSCRITTQVFPNDTVTMSRSSRCRRVSTSSIVEATIGYLWTRSWRGVLWSGLPFPKWSNDARAGRYAVGHAFSRSQLTRWERARTLDRLAS